MPDNLTPLQRCVTSWWRAQNRLAPYRDEMLTAFKRATTTFMRGPWLDEAFALGWTPEQLFGATCNGEAMPGLVVLLAVGEVTEIIEFDAEAVLVLMEEEVVQIRRETLQASGPLWWEDPAIVPMAALPPSARMLAAMPASPTVH
jgi:hypothetical protein